MVSEFIVEERPRHCPICDTRMPSRRHTIYGWICWLCLQRYDAGKDAAAMAADERDMLSGVKPAKPQSDSQEKSWEPEAKTSTMSATAKPRAASPTAPSPRPSPPRPTTATPAEPVSPKAAAATRIADGAGEVPVVAAPVAAAPQPDPDALIQDRVLAAMLAEPSLPSATLAARLGLSASGVRSCVCRLRKRGLLPPTTRLVSQGSRPPAGVQKEAIRAAMLAEPTISSKDLAARLGTTPDTVRSCISLLRRSGALPPAPVAAAPPPSPVRPRETMLLERIRVAMLAEPRVTSTVLAARFNTTPPSVRSAAAILRQRGLLPPAPVRPVIEPDTMRGRLLRLITEQPGIGGIRAAQILGTTESVMHDTFSALRKRGLILPADPGRPGGYPLPSASSQEPPMPVQPDPTPAAPLDLVAIAEALGIDQPEEATEHDVLQAARAQGEAVARLLDEKRFLRTNLDLSRSNLDAADAQIREMIDELADLRQQVSAAAANRLTLTREDLDNRIADLRAADDAAEDAEAILRAADEGVTLTSRGIDITPDDLRVIAARREEQARVLHQRALEGR